MVYDKMCGFIFFQTYSSSSQKREAKLARILVTIVFCFLFCNLGKLVLSIYDLGNLGKVICNAQAPMCRVTHALINKDT